LLEPFPSLYSISTLAKFRVTFSVGRLPSLPPRETLLIRT
jgi:hypothetical protein